MERIKVTTRGQGLKTLSNCFIHTCAHTIVQHFVKQYYIVHYATSVTSKPVYGLETLPKSMKPIVDTSKKAKICAMQAFEGTAGETIDS